MIHDWRLKNFNRFEGAIHCSVHSAGHAAPQSSLSGAGLRKSKKEGLESTKKEIIRKRNISERKTKINDGIKDIWI